MALSETQRTQLDGIVQKAQGDGRDTQFIKSLVSDYKTKYDTPQNNAPQESIMQKAGDWLNKPAYPAADVAQSGLVGGVLKGGANFLKSGAKFAAGAVDFMNPVSTIKKVGELGKDIYGAAKEGVNPLDVAKAVPGAAYKTLVPQAAQMAIAGHPTQALGSLSEDPFQVAPALLMAKGALENTPFGKTTAGKIAGKAVDTGMKAVAGAPKLVAKGVGAVAKAGVEGVKKGVDIVTQGKGVGLGDPIDALKGYASESVKKSINEDVSGLLKATRAIGNKAQQAETQNVDLQKILSDPQIFKGLKVEKAKIVPDEAIATVDSRIQTLLDAKSEILPHVDALVPPVPKSVLLQRAFDDIAGDLPPKDEAELKARIEAQVEALPDEMKPSEIDKLRAQMRKASRDAKGQMKSDSEYAALENASRDTVIDITNKLPVKNASEYVALNDYVKQMITTKTFLDKTLRNQVVKGGRARGYAIKLVGAIAGASHGPLGTIVGSEIGGLVSDIVTNNALGSNMKMNLIKGITDDPEILAKAEQLAEQMKQTPKPPSTPPTEGTIPESKPPESTPPKSPIPKAPPKANKVSGSSEKPVSPIPQEGQAQEKVTDPTKFVRAEKLSPEFRALETKAFDYILKNEDAILAAYKKKYNKFVNADNFRPFLKDAGYTDGSMSAAVQEPVSYLAKRAVGEELKNPGDYAVAMAGGSGVGKTSAAKTIPQIKDVQDNASMVLDSNFSSMKSAKRFIAQVKKSGKQFIGVYTYRDFIDSLTNGIVARMLTNKEEMGRSVPNTVTAGNHIGSWGVIQELVDKGHKFLFADNSLGLGNAKLSSIEDFKSKIKYPSEEELTKMANDEIKRLYESKTPFEDDEGIMHIITKKQYDSLVQ